MSGGAGWSRRLALQASSADAACSWRDGRPVCCGYRSKHRYGGRLKYSTRRCPVATTLSSLNNVLFGGPMSLDLTARQKSALKRAALNGDYHLLLGAGASRESIAPDGATLPTGLELTDQIADQFQVPFEPGDMLWRVYARAVDEVGQDMVYAWLRRRFWGV